MAPGFVYSRDGVLTPDTTVTLSDSSPTAIWREIATDRGFRRAIVEAIRDDARGKTPGEYRDELRGFGLPMGFEDLVVRIADGSKDDMFRFFDGIENLGTGWTTLEQINAVAGLLGADDHHPTIEVKVTRAFMGRRRDQAESVFELLRTLAQGCEVRVVSSLLVRQELANRYRQELPGVSEACKTHQDGLPTDAAVEQAWNELSWDDREITILRLLADTGANNASYHSIRSEVSVSRTRVSQCISRLDGLGLIDTYEPSGGKRAELRQAGSAFLDRLDAELGQQATLEMSVNETGKSSIYCRVSPERDGPPEETDTTTLVGPADRRRMGEVVEPEFMPRWREAGLAASATDGAITLLNHPVESDTDIRQPYVSYDGDDRLVVGAEYLNPMQYMVCIARALASYGTFADVLTPELLDGNVGNLGGLAMDDPHLLRNATCLGWMKDRDTQGELFIKQLRRAEEELCTMTREWREGSYSCDPAVFRSRITRFAHGLAGTVSHLCDLAGIDVVRELRLHELTRRFDEERRAEAVETVVTAAKISSSHGHFAAYRQLFEDRTDKRNSAIEPTIPADDPSGEMIGSFVIVGEKAESLDEEFRSQLRNDDERVHEDAPGFDVPVPLNVGTGRSATALVVRDRLAAKRMSATHESVALFDALAGSPLDVAQALQFGLERESVNRSIRLDEVRVALSTLSADRILPTMQPTIRNTVHALLTIAQPLSQSELADRAGVSTRSLRTHLPRLEALGLLSRSEAGIRFTLPFSTDEERGSRILPGLADPKGPKATDVLYDLVAAIDGYESGAADVFAEYPLEEWIERLRSLPGYGRWVELAEALAVSPLGICPEAGEITLRFGKPPEQAALKGVAD